MSIPRLVVGVDGSQHSDLAVRWAADEAVRRGAALELVTVVPSPRLVPWSILTPPRADDEAALETAAERVLTSSAATVASVAPQLRVETVCASGRPAEVLVQASERAAFLVLGPHGQGGLGGAFERLLMGSVATHATAHARCPVVIVRPEPDVASDRVVVGVDGSAASLGAVHLAAEMASRRGAELVALHAWSSPGRHLHAAGWADAEWRRAVEADALLALSESLAGERTEHPDVVFAQRLVHDHPVSALAAASAEASLLVLGSHGRGAFAGMVLGAVTHEMLRLARCSVIVVRTAAG